MSMRKKKSGSSNSGAANEKLTIALDVGSSVIRLLAGYVADDKQIKVKGYLECSSAGFDKGSISDIDKLAKRIAFLIQDFQTKFAVTVHHVVTGVPGFFIRAENQRGTSTVQEGIVSVADRNRAIKNAIAGIKNINDTDYTIIHSNPQNYITEISQQVSNPVGQYAKRIDVNVHVIGCKNFFKKNMELVINKTSPDINVSGMVYVGNASSSSVLAEAEKEIGVINIDIGSCTTSVTVFEGKRQLISFGVSDGSDYITKNIAKEYSIPVEDAEQLKLKLGAASRYLLTEEQAQMRTIMEIDNGQGHREQIEFVVGEVADIINKSLNSMFEWLFVRIVEEVRQISSNSLEIGGGIVLTGGGAKLYGIDRVLSSLISQVSEDPTYQILKCNSKVRLGHPNGIAVEEGCGCDLNTIRDSDRAVVTGLLRAAKFEDLRQYSEDIYDDKKEGGSTINRFFRGLKDWTKREL